MEVMETRKKQPTGRVRRPGSLEAATTLTGPVWPMVPLLSLNLFQLITR